MTIEAEHNPLEGGDPEDFRRMFHAHAAVVLAVCVRILRNPQDAEDVASEVFLEAWRKRRRYDPARATVRGYLTLMARSRALDRYRSRSREAARAEGRLNTGAMTLDGSEETDLRTSRPDQLVADREMHRIARNAVEDLSESQRVPVELSFFDGMSHAKIAERLGMPLGTVKSNIRRGLQQLRDALTAFHGGANRDD